MTEEWAAIGVIGLGVLVHLGAALWHMSRLTSNVSAIRTDLTKFITLAEDHNDRVIRLEEQARNRDRNTAEWHKQVEAQFSKLHRKVEELRNG